MANVVRARRTGQESRQWGLGEENKADWTLDTLTFSDDSYRLDAAIVGYEESTAYYLGVDNDELREDRSEVVSGGHFETLWNRSDDMPADGFVPEVYGVQGIARYNPSLTLTTDIAWVGPVGGYFNGYAQHTSGSVASAYGVNGRAGLTGTTGDGNATSLFGGAFDVFTSGAKTGTATNAYALAARRVFNHAGAVTNSYGVHIGVPTGSVNPSNNYGLYIIDQSAKGSTASRNILSAGATAVNEFVGRVIMGAPDSAIADGTLSASEMSFYLNEAGNTVTVKAKYAGGTVKTGTIALT